jgi:hypothetical protein
VAEPLPSRQVISTPNHTQPTLKEETTMKNGRTPSQVANQPEGFKPLSAAQYKRWASAADASLAAVEAYHHVTGTTPQPGCPIVNADEQFPGLLQLGAAQALYEATLAAEDEVNGARWALEDAQGRLEVATALLTSLQESTSLLRRSFARLSGAEGLDPFAGPVDF